MQKEVAVLVEQRGTGVKPIGSLPARAELIAEELRRAILSGELPPGSPLVERDVAVSLGVSKTPVREAIKTLVAKQLVEVSPYKGATVRRVDPAFAQNVYAVRLMLEPEAARLATAHLAARAPFAVEAIDEAAQELELAQAVGKRREFSLLAAHNRAFHQALAIASDNPVLLRVLAELQDQTALVATQGWRREETWQDEAAEHHAILVAVQSGDSDMAATLMRRHIERALAGLRERLANRQEAATDVR